jgi:hypothetical protein
MQLFPQLPQLFASVWKFVQKVGAPDAGHWFGFETLFAQEHAPETHAASVAHWFPHVPQLLPSVSRLAQ